MQSQPPNGAETEPTAVSTKTLACEAAGGAMVVAAVVTVVAAAASINRGESKSQEQAANRRPRTPIKPPQRPPPKKKKLMMVPIPMTTMVMTMMGSRLNASTTAGLTVQHWKWWKRTKPSVQRTPTRRGQNPPPGRASPPIAGSRVEGWKRCAPFLGALCLLREVLCARGMATTRMRR